MLILLLFTTQNKILWCAKFYNTQKYKAKRGKDFSIIYISKNNLEFYLVFKIISIDDRTENKVYNVLKVWF